jgi:hypothetical protein
VSEPRPTTHRCARGHLRLVTDDDLTVQLGASVEQLQAAEEAFVAADPYLAYLRREVAKTEAELRQQHRRRRADRGRP